MTIKGIKLIKRTYEHHSIANELKHVNLNDRRLEKRLKKTAELLEKSPESSIPKACQTIAQTKATYRLLDNIKLSPNHIIDSHRIETIKRVKDHPIILIAQDTTSLNFSTHKKTKGLGPLGTSDSLFGLLMHTAFCLTTQGVPLGILAQKMWAREFDQRGKSTLRKTLPIEAKESYKWLELMGLSLQGLPKDTIAVTVADREADIYEFIRKAIQLKSHLLIRATHDRCVANEQKRLYNQIQSSPVLGECTIQVPRNAKLNIKAREANLVVKSFKTAICPPVRSDKSWPNLSVSVIYAEEQFPPKGVEPIKWLLITTLDVNNLESAIEKIEWYCHRWKIERFHFVLKSGCEIEELQLETSTRLKNAIALYSVLAWKLTWIIYQSRETPDAPCSVILNESEWKVLYRLVNPKVALPKKPPTLKEAVILIARLGGFLARKNDGDPGVKVLWQGYHRFYNSLETLVALDLSPFS
jgi:hypothetical protein